MIYYGHALLFVIQNQDLLIYVNDLSENLVSNPKLSADDTSLFSVIFDMDLSAKNLNDVLNRINNWAFQ